MNYVVLRCAQCRAVLCRVPAVEPPNWSDTTVFVPRCRSCDMPDPRRIVDYMMRKDVDGVPLGGDMPMYAIREEVTKARAKGKDVGVSVRFSEDADGLHLHLKT